MNEKIYIISGSHQEFLNWRKFNHNPIDRWYQNIIYVQDTMTLKGQHNPHGRFIGTWYKRTDIDQILLQLLMSGMDHDKYDQILVTKDKLNGVQVDTKLYGMNPDGTIVDGIDPLNLTVAAMNAILINSPT